jgi:hypothetical protein
MGEIVTDRAQQEPSEPAETSGSHDHQVGAVGQPHQDLTGTTVSHDRPDRGDPGGVRLGQRLVDDAASVLVERRVRVGGGGSGVGGRVPGLDDVDARLENPSLVQRPVQRSLRRLRGIPPTTTHFRPYFEPVAPARTIATGMVEWCRHC